MSIYNNYDDYERGRAAMVFFHNTMTLLYPKKYQVSFQELENIISSRKGGKMFIEGMGTGIIFAEMSEGKVSDAMTALARQSQGQIPATNSVFTQALINSAQKFNFIDATKTVAIETGKDVIRASAAIGDAVIDAGKGVTTTISLLKYALPVLVLGGAALYVYSRAK